MKCNQFKQACDKFKINDYVYIYVSGVDESLRHAAYVVEIDYQRGMKVKSRIDGNADPRWFHPRQCRIVKTDLGSS